MAYAVQAAHGAAFFLADADALGLDV